MFLLEIVIFIKVNLKCKSSLILSPRWLATKWAKHYIDLRERILRFKNLLRQNPGRNHEIMATTALRVAPKFLLRNASQCYDLTVSKTYSGNKKRIFVLDITVAPKDAARLGDLPQSHR